MASPEAEASLGRMLEGNRRFVAGTTVHPHQSAGRRRKYWPNRRPLPSSSTVLILGFPRAVIFDCGLGDLFDHSHGRPRAWR